MARICRKCGLSLNETPEIPKSNWQESIAASADQKHLQNCTACITSCGHLFHKCCLFDHFAKNATFNRNTDFCPHCNTKVYMRQIHPVFWNSSTSGGSTLEPIGPLTGDDCPICWDALNESPVIPQGENADIPKTGQQLRNVDICSTKCGHVFHKYCLLKHFAHKTISTKRNKSVCPTCKATIYVRDLNPVKVDSSASVGGPEKPIQSTNNIAGVEPTFANAPNPPNKQVSVFDEAVKRTSSEECPIPLKKANTDLEPMFKLSTAGQHMGDGDNKNSNASFTNADPTTSVPDILRSAEARPPAVVSPIQKTNVQPPKAVSSVVTSQAPTAVVPTPKPFSLFQQPTSYTSASQLSTSQSTLAPQNATKIPSFSVKGFGTTATSSIPQSQSSQKKEESESKSWTSWFTDKFS